MRDLLFLNTWIYLAAEDQEYNTVLKEVIHSFEEINRSSCIPNVERNKDTFIELFTQYRTRLVNFGKNMAMPPKLRHKVPAEQIKKGDLIFSSKFGLCGLHNKRLSSDKIAMVITRPGFSTNGEENVFVYQYELPLKHQIITF